MKDIIKSVVKMDLDSDADGYVYFNELLFKTLKRIYGEEREKNMIVINEELRTLKIIKQTKEMMLKRQRQQLRKQAMTVNPFVIKMFKNISFKSWVNLYLQNSSKRKSQVEEKGDVEISEADIEEEEKIEEDQYYYETEKDESCSDNDEPDVDNQSLEYNQNIENLNKELSRLDGGSGFNT